MRWCLMLLLFTHVKYLTTSEPESYSSSVKVLQLAQIPNRL